MLNAQAYCAAGLVGSVEVDLSETTAATGGLGNPFFATIELGGSLFTSILALLAPLLAVGMIFVVLFFFGRKAFRRFNRAQPTPVPPMIS